MRFILVVCLLFLIPPLTLLYGDYTRAGGGEFKLSTVADVWMDYDRASFDQFKSGYVSRPEEWERDVRPYLEWKALPLSCIPAVLFYVFLFTAFVTGFGPFRDFGLMQHRQDDADFARSAALKHGPRQRFKRK